MHLVAFTPDLGDDLLLVGDPRLLLLDEPVSDALDLGTDWIESIIVVLDSVTLFLLNSSLKRIPTGNSFNYQDPHVLCHHLHSLVVDTPLLAEDSTLFIDLASQVVTQLSQPVLKFFLEGVQGIMNVAHGISRLLLVLLNLTAQIDNVVRHVNAATYV